MESCNNCEIVEKENKKLRLLVEGLQQKNTIMQRTNEDIIKRIVKVSGVKIVHHKEFRLPGEPEFSIVKDTVNPE